MNESKISVRYAKALLSFAKENNSIESIKNDIKLIDETCHIATDFNQVLENPVVTSSQKQNLLYKIFADKVNPITIKFLNLILKNKREVYLRDITRVFLDFYRKEKGIKKAVLTTSKPVSTEMIAKIKTMLTINFKTQIELSEKQDNKIIGGFLLRVEDQQIDSSVASKLKKMKKTLKAI